MLRLKSRPGPAPSKTSAFAPSWIRPAIAGPSSCQTVAYPVELIVAWSRRMVGAPSGRALRVAAGFPHGLRGFRRWRSAAPPRDSRRILERRERMKALVYHGPGLRAWETVPDPVVVEPTDAIVRIGSSTICGTDLH